MERKVKMKAGQLSEVQKAFSNIKGDRPLMLSFKISELLDPVISMNDKLMERLRDHVDERGMVLDGHMEQVEAILNEEVEFDAPEITMQDLISCDSLTVSDDFTLVFLKKVGALT